MRSPCCYLRFIASAPRKDKHFPRGEGPSVRVQPVQDGSEQKVVLEVNRDRVARLLEPDQPLVRGADPLEDMRRIADIDRSVAAAVHDQCWNLHLRQFLVEHAQQMHQALDADGWSPGM